MFAVGRFGEVVFAENIVSAIVGNPAGTEALHTGLYPATHLPMHPPRLPQQETQAKLTFRQVEKFCELRGRQMHPPPLNPNVERLIREWFLLVGCWAGSKAATYYTATPTNMHGNTHMHGTCA